MNNKSGFESVSKRHQRLNVKYIRLIDEWNTQAVSVSIEDISSVLICTQRYARSLLKEMIDEGYVNWSSRPGRGARGYLKCLISKDELLSREGKVKDNNNGYKYKGNVFDDDKICIPFYRPIGSLIPSFKSERAELHLIKMIHSCLTRLNSNNLPVPDLAHKIEHSDDYTKWYFHLRTGLVWHNGELVINEQLLEVTKKNLANVEFEHVSSVELDSDKTLIINLSRPDAILPYRLANPIYSLHHPENGEVGLGAFLITSNNKEKVILQRAPLYYGFTPLVQKIEYIITNDVVGYEWTTVVLKLPSESAREAHTIKENIKSPGYVFMAFNLNKNNLTNEQRKLIRAIVYLSSKSLKDQNNVNVFDDVNPCHFDKNVSLPKTLSLAYFWSKETEVTASFLKKQLLFRGCKLELHPVDANHWFNQMDWDSIDIGISDLSFNPICWLSTEERFKKSNMIKSFMPLKSLLKIEKILNKFAGNERSYKSVSCKIIKLLVRLNVINPLFSYIFKVKATSRIRGVSVSSQGWPDFTKIWIQDTHFKHTRSNPVTGSGFHRGVGCLQGGGREAQKPIGYSKVSGGVESTTSRKIG